MAKLPQGWRVYGRDDPDRKFRLTKGLVARYRATEVLGWPLTLHRFGLWSLIVIGLIALGWRMLNREPPPPPPHPSTWSAEMRAKHQAARPSCDAARAAGLAAASKGYPGYWPHLDADNDGISCEWSLGIPSISLRTLIGGK
jgi:hypothetical protein